MLPLPMHRVKDQLRHLLTLEMALVSLYQSQQNYVADPTLRRALGHFTEAEAGHVENLTRLLERYEAQPSGLHQVAQPLGCWIGRMSKALGPRWLISLDAWIEQLMSREYRQLIACVSDTTLLDLLWKHMIDEEMHRTWFESTLLRLQSILYSNR